MLVAMAARRTRFQAMTVTRAFDVRPSVVVDVVFQRVRDRPRAGQDPHDE